MKAKWFSMTLVMIMLLIAAVPVVSAAPAPEVAVEAPYVVIFDMDNLPADVEGLVAGAGGKLLFWFPQVGIAVTSAESGSFADQIGASVFVDSVGLTGQWGLPETTVYAPELEAPTATDSAYYQYQWDIRRVGADQAWAAGVTGSHDTVVAVIDTGIDASHPDLAPNVVYQACMQLTGPCPAGTFTHWHGTHVSGTVAATFGGGLVVGVGPNLGLAGYQVFEPSGSAWDGPIWWAIMDAADQGFEVINMSLGGYVPFGQTQGEGAAVWTAWNRVVNYAIRNGVTVVASAGNGNVDVNGTIYHIPGDLSGIINVGATGIQPAPIYPQAGSFDIRAFYSNYGAAVTLSAPGGDCGLVDSCNPATRPANYFQYLVLSTMPGGNYSWAGGTSMAAPHVAAAAALVKDVNSNLNPRQVASILKSTADNIGSRQLFGAGMLDVYEAVTK